MLLGVLATEHGRVPRALRIADIDVDELRARIACRTASRVQALGTVGSCAVHAMQRAASGLGTGPPQSGQVRAQVFPKPGSSSPSANVTEPSNSLATVTVTRSNAFFADGNVGWESLTRSSTDTP